VTISDVARAANVSISTVSNYLNNRGRMSDETHRRVSGAIRDLHYAPSALTLALKRGRTGIIGVLTSGLSDSPDNNGRAIAPALLYGINHAANEASVELLMYTGWPHRRSRYTEQDFANGHIDGLIWISPHLDDPLLPRVVDTGVAVQVLLSSATPAQAGWVCSDNAGGTRAVMQHLLDLGHRRIAFIGTTHCSDFVERLDAYRAALIESGIAADAELELIHDTYLYASEELKTPLFALLGAGVPPTAIVAADDGIASRVIDVLKAAGLRIPEDISVTGFNDMLEARTICGGMTTLRQDFTEIGRLGVESLLLLLEGGDVNECRRTVPMQLVIRNTTGPAHPLR
jgi:DNA-binding LacI/PurR family transcriptional regulator